MAILKCKMCGGNLELADGQTVAECEYCGTQQTVPSADSEKKLNLFARANRLRFGCDFDKAAAIYETILAEFPQEAEAYWGLVLCKYGIAYVDDPATGKKIPTCHRSSFASVLDDPNLELAQEYADVTARRLYREEAKQIEMLRKGIIEVSGKEAPYDVFICYKESDEKGQRTIDSVLAQDVYDALTEKGYRVFFSRISLEDKLGQEYEPYIFAALHSARVMLVFGTDHEYFNAIWVKNEWSRYLLLMTQDKNKHLVPCYKGIDPYDMPKAFQKLQAQDMGKVGAVQDLLRGIDKLIGRASPPVQAPQASAAAPDAPAPKEKKPGKKPLAAILAAAAAGVAIAAFLVWNFAIAPANRYAKAQAMMESGDYTGAMAAFSQLGDYQDSKELLMQCQEGVYVQADKLLRDGKLDAAIAGFTALGSYKDSPDKILQCQQEQRYLEACGLLERKEYDQALAIFDLLGNYKDTMAKVQECQLGKQYAQAAALAQQGDYAAACTILSALGDYQDAPALLESYRWKACAVGDIVTFGSYPADALTEQNGASFEPISWRVLAKHHGKVLLLAVSILDSQPYDENFETNDWVDCSLRRWLNTDFFDRAFLPGEQTRICTTETILAPGGEYNSIGDLVFLLSKEEAQVYLPTTLERRCDGTAYAKSMGLLSLEDDWGEGGAYWWLRERAYIDDDGDFPSRYDAPANTTEIGVRPAIWVSLD